MEVGQVQVIDKSKSLEFFIQKGLHERETVDNIAFELVFFFFFD